jgi:hypothetical protein
MRESLFRAYAAPTALLGFFVAQGLYLTWLVIAYADIYTPSLPIILTLGLSVVSVGFAGFAMRLVHRRRSAQQRMEDVKQGTEDIERLTREFEELDKNNVVGAKRREKLLELQATITKFARKDLP